MRDLYIGRCVSVLCGNLRANSKDTFSFYSSSLLLYPPFHIVIPPFRLWRLLFFLANWNGFGFFFFHFKATLTTILLCTHNAKYFFLYRKTEREKERHTERKTEGEKAHKIFCRMNFISVCIRGFSSESVCPCVYVSVCVCVSISLSMCEYVCVGFSILR